MSVPVEFFVNMYPKILHYVNMFECLVVESVFILNWFPFPCYTDDFTFFGVELHHPDSFPFLESVEVLLEKLCVSVAGYDKVDHGVVCKEADC